ncbi:MAG: hypothetical protein IT294_18030 [Deltaproteobacteria bacterium]|nr:hypothetical protein [Deltaproteobacteria bacterium]
MPFGAAHRPRPETRRQEEAFAVLDAVLDRGFPEGGVAQVFGGPSSGKTTLAHRIVSSFVRRGECAAWVDLPDAFDPDGARDAGVDLDRVLWVAPRDPVMAVRAVELVLGAGGFRVVVLDLGGSLAGRLRLPAAAWLRVSRAATVRRATLVVLAATCVAGTFATLVLEASVSRPVFSPPEASRSFFEGTVSALRVRKCRGGPPVDRPLRFFASPTR